MVGFEGSIVPTKDGGLAEELSQLSQREGFWLGLSHGNGSAWFAGGMLDQRPLDIDEKVEVTSCASNPKHGR